MKICSRCKGDKPYNQFHRNRRSLDGRQAYCKECNITYQKVSGSARIEKYRKSNPVINARHQGIKWHPQVADTLLWKFQKNKCAICQRPQGERILHRDHNHVTGWLRGLLCHNCNVRLPSKHCDKSLAQAKRYLEDQNCFSKKYITDALYYLENPPYFRLLEFKKITRPTGTYAEFQQTLEFLRASSRDDAPSIWRLSGRTT